jgi:hypothetical protein
MSFVATLALCLWPQSYFGSVDLDVGLWNGAREALTSKEATIFTYRGGIGLMLRRRWLPHDPPGRRDVGIMWSGPSLNIGPAQGRDEFAMGDPMFDIGGLYVGHSRGPHNGVIGPSLVVDHVFAMPLWLLALLSSIWPITALRRSRRERRGMVFDVLAPPALSPIAAQP